MADTLRIYNFLLGAALFFPCSVASWHRAVEFLVSVSNRVSLTHSSFHYSLVINTTILWQRDATCSILTCKKKIIIIFIIFYDILYYLIFIALVLLRINCHIISRLHL